MKRTFTASITQEGVWFVAQCLEVDIASQGESEEAALQNLGEAIALHLTPPITTALPEVRQIEVEIDSAGPSCGPMMRGPWEASKRRRLPGSGS